MTQDKYFGAAVSLADPANEGYSVVPHASNPLPNGVPRFLYVGTAGNLVVKLPDSPDDLTYTDVKGWLPIRPSHIRNTGTAGNIIAHY